MQLTLDFTCYEDAVSPLSEGEIESVCARVLEEEGVERPCFVSVSLVDEEAMRELNAEWRDIDKVTDVLSLECEQPDDPLLAPGEPCELGDIVLAPAYIERQAAQLATPFKTEFTLLLVHGMLHLLGYDHLEEDEAAVMEEREDAIVSLIVGAHAHARLTRHEEGDE